MERLFMPVKNSRLMPFLLFPFCRSGRRFQSLAGMARHSTFAKQPAPACRFRFPVVKLQKARHMIACTRPGLTSRAAPSDSGGRGATVLHFSVSCCGKDLPRAFGSAVEEICGPYSKFI